MMGGRLGGSRRMTRLELAWMFASLFLIFLGGTGMLLLALLV